MLRSKVGGKLLGCLSGGYRYDGELACIQWYPCGKITTTGLKVTNQMLSQLLQGQLRDYSTMVNYCAERPCFLVKTAEQDEYSFVTELRGYVFFVHTRIPMNRINFWIYVHKFVPPDNR